MTQFLTTDTALSAYMAYPKFLLEMIDLGETAKLVYIVLLDRARISQVKGGWADENGNVFIFYPIRDLAKDVHKSEMSVKTALSALEKCGLILRKRQGIGKANRIYVKLPVDRNLSARQTENCPSDGKKTVCHMERKLSGNKNKESKTNKSKRRSKAYGKFQNVLLSDGDMDSLRQTVPQYRDYIERLSAYMQSTGKSYADHAATIRCLYECDNPAQPSRNYECKDDESL
ncbi:MAG: replication initiator protein A [Ruminococcus sp.]|nr:replication initiator protein A [Ruminococcus sp.]